MEGDLDVPLLEASLTWLARRHSALRTYFPETTSPNLGLCLFPREVAWQLSHFDLRTTQASCPEASEIAILTELQQPLAPDLFPMFRGYLLRHDGHWLLGIAISHIIFDGESVAVFLRDLQYVYQHLHSGRDPNELAAEQSDFARFVAWERGLLESSEARRSMRYWNDIWAGIGPYPTFRVPVEPGQTGEDDGLWLQTVPLECIDRRRSEFRDGHLSLFALTAGSVLKALSDVTRSTECGLLYSTSRREVESAGNMIGFLNSRSLLRVRVPDGADSYEVQRSARSAILESMEHNMLPFEFLEERLAPGYASSRPDPYIHLNVDSAPEAPQLHGVKTELTWPVTPGAFEDAPYVTIDVSRGAEGHQATVGCGYPTRLCGSGFISELMERVVESLTSLY
jgi:Condensation domain